MRNGSAVTIIEPERRQRKTETISKEKMALLRSRFLLPDEQSVQTFLDQRPNLAAVALTAANMIPKYFASSGRPVLEVVSDPEFASYQALSLRIPTDLSPSDALDRLDRFDAEWWLSASRDAGELMIIDVERA